MSETTLLRESLDKQLLEFKTAATITASTREELLTAEDLLVDLEEAHTLIGETARLIQSRVHARISSVVTKCLSAIFDDPYQFQIQFESKGGRTEAKILFVRNEIGVDPLTASGGGVVDVAAFALRLACLTLRRPALRKLLVLDEPFRFVSASYREKIRSLLEAITTEFNVQVIMVTHINELRCGAVIEIE